MLLSSIIKSIKNQYGISPIAINSDADIASICADSRLIEPGAIFVCMPSHNTRTHDLIPEAIQKGAKAFIVHSQEGFKSAQLLGQPCMLVENHDHFFNRYLGYFCQIFYKDPTLSLKIIGITGTNGKTTSSCMLRDALEYLGQKTAYVGTLGYRSQDHNELLPNATPYPVKLWEILNQIHQAGNKNLVMEVTSEGQHQNRVSGMSFDVGAFTNFTQDHLNYHQTMQAYAAAKKLFFTQVASASHKEFKAVIGTDDAQGAAWFEEFKLDPNSSLQNIISFGLQSGDLHAHVKNATLTSLEIEVTYQNCKDSFQLNFGGFFNVLNALTAIGCLLSLGFSLKKSCEALSCAKHVDGRFEPIENKLGLDILVDYAHSPDSLVNLLESVKSLARGKIITVIGCGGDRDKSKRPLMAKAASQYSGITLLTSDNPRTEDPIAILEDVKPGIVPGKKYEVIVDRREAITRAIEIANYGDAVVIAGKGHEDYQIIGHIKYPFDDRQVTREILRQKDESFKSKILC